MGGWFAKKSSASSHDMSSTSATVVPLERDLERLAVVTGSTAHLAGHVHVGQEVHLDLDRAVTRAAFAPTAAHVEGEAARQVSADLGLGGLAEQLPNVVEKTRVRGGIRTGRAPDRRLVDRDDLVYELHALDRLVCARVGTSPVHLRQHRLEKDVVHERRLPRTGDSGHRISGNPEGRRRRFRRDCARARRAPPGARPSPFGASQEPRSRALPSR